MTDLVVLLVSSIALSLLGLIIVTRNVHSITYQLFGLMTATSVAWFFANYFTNHIQDHNLQLFVNKLSLFVGFLLIQAMWLLSLYFPKKIAEHKIQKLVSIIITPILLLITLFTDGVVQNVHYLSQQNVSEIVSGRLYYLYIFSAFVFFLFLAFNFYKSYTSNSAGKLEKQQIIYASIGFLLSFVWSILAAAIIPAITNNWAISKYAATGSWFVLVFLSYAIIRHKLFDIRIIVARSIAYILTLLTLALIFVTPSIVITNYFLKVPLKTSSLIILVFVTFFVAFVFQPIRQIFNRLTNRFFYRDYYEPQDVLTKLSNTLVGSIEVDHIVQGSSNILSAAIRPQSMKYTLIVRENGQEDKELEKLLRNAKADMVSVDDINQNDDPKVYTRLRESNISLSVKLRTSKEVLGFMLFGYKQSGMIYNDTDKSMLGIAADEIAISLQNALRFEEIENFNLTLQAKVDEATSKLRRANERLKALDETKDDFISMASHQLRTPLTSVKGYISMVLEGDAGKITKVQGNMLNQAFSLFYRMVYLIADLLNVSRLKTGKFVIESSTVNLADVVEQELSQLQETAKARSLKLVYNKPKDFPSVTLDETKTRQVVMNFVDNAIYYTPAGGEIDVKLIDNPETIELRVVDNGIGVPKSEQPHLFTKFYRAGNARKARPDGTGLGLFMAKKVILAEGGSLVFESQEGKGSTFGFVFSKAQLKAASNQKTPPKSKQLATVN